MNNAPRRFILPVVVLLLLLGVALAAPGWAQAPVPATTEGDAIADAETAAEAATSEEPAVAPDSPRASLQAYLDDGRAGEWEKAAHYLALPESRKAEGPTLARRLKAVLDRHVWFDHEEISPASGGNQDDGLSRNVERVARIPVGDDRTQPVYMVRRSGDDAFFWAFSPNTVGRIDGWYDQLEDRWIRDRLPEALLLPGPLGVLLRWQWIALPLLLLGAWALGRLLGRATQVVLGRVFARTRTEWDDKLLKRIGAPLTFAWGLAVFYAGLPSLSLTAHAAGLFHSLVGAGAVIVVFWALWRSVDVIAEILVVSPWAEGSPAARNLLQISANILKGVIAGVGALAVLSAFGYPVNTLLAGLGIGGLAFALAARSTLENVVGSFMIFADKPYRVGQRVKVMGQDGTVESIGLRSTRIRLLTGHLTSIPNEKMASVEIENIGRRPYIRRNLNVTITYDTPPEKINRAVEILRDILSVPEAPEPELADSTAELVETAATEGETEPHPNKAINRRDFPPRVYFNDLNPDSLNILVVYWYHPAEYWDYLEHAHWINVQIMERFNAEGIDFAFPTQTLHLAGDDKRPLTIGQRWVSEDENSYDGALSVQTEALHPVRSDNPDTGQ